MPHRMSWEEVAKFWEVVNRVILNETFNVNLTCLFYDGYGFLGFSTLNNKRSNW